MSHLVREAFAPSNRLGITRPARHSSSINRRNAATRPGTQMSPPGLRTNWLTRPVFTPRRLFPSCRGESSNAPCADRRGFGTNPPAPSARALVGIVTVVAVEPDGAGDGDGAGAGDGVG